MIFKSLCVLGFFWPKNLCKKKNTTQITWRKIPSKRNKTRILRNGHLEAIQSNSSLWDLRFFLLFFRCICCGTLLLELTSHQTGSLENHRLKKLTFELGAHRPGDDRWPWPFRIPQRWVGHQKALSSGHRFHHPKKVTFSPQNCQGLWIFVVDQTWWCLIQNLGKLVAKKNPKPEYLNLLPFDSAFLI